MKNFYFIFLLFLSTVLLSGCSPATQMPDGGGTKSVTDTQIPVANTETPTVTATITPTASLTPILFTPTPQIPPEARLQIKQMQIFDRFPNDEHGHGYAVLSEWGWDSVLVVDLAHSEKWQIALPGGHQIPEFGILSRDEKWVIRLKNLDVQEPGEEIYEVLSSQGQVKSAFRLPKGWNIRYSWVNDRQILADKQKDPENLIHQTMAIDAFSGQTRLLPFDYPGICDIYSFGDYDDNVYDPSLKYVIYPALQLDAPPGVIVRDVNKRTNILSVPETFGEPVWSPDGKMFAIRASAGIYGGYLNGELKKLTHIDRLGAYVDGEVIRWSPDGRKIAFSMTTTKNPDLSDPQCLAILDVQSEAVVDYCIPGYDIKSSFGFSGMVWAPDSRSLLVDARKGDSDYTESLLIDLDKEIAVDLDYKFDPLYFIDTLPSIWDKK
jgi:hypothetical protein